MVEEKSAEAPETTYEAESKVPDTTDVAALEAFYRENFNLGLPDMIIGLTPDGVADAFRKFFVANSLIPENKTIQGFITDIKFGGEGGTLPVAVYYDNSVEIHEAPEAVQ